MTTENRRRRIVRPREPRGIDGLRPLPDYLPRGAALMFVGFNPGEESARRGHYYANRTNLFWPALCRSGLAPEPLTCEDDYRLPDFGIAITDLAKRPSRSAGDLPPGEFRAGREVLLRKVKRVGPRVVAFNGKGVYRLFSGRPCELGVQPESLCGARVFVLPSTSARYARMPREEKLEWFRRLKRLLHESRQERVAT